MNSSFTSISFLRIQERSGHQQIQVQKFNLGQCLMLMELLVIFTKNMEKFKNGQTPKYSCMFFMLLYDQQKERSPVDFLFCIS